MSYWTILGQTGLLEMVVSANTKSEARSKFKKAFGMKRLPKGTKVARTK